MSKPPYTITSTVLKLVSDISEKIGEINAAHLTKTPAQLRKQNRIKTIQASLEIEGNTLTISQVTDIINNKRVLAPEKDILEVKNAINLYNQLAQFSPFSETSLLKAHKILMQNLIADAGKFRTKSVGILKGENVTHIAPQGHMVKSLIQNFLNYLKKDDDLLLVKSCVFHYEFEFIHPFLDGNGRLGRFWQTLILTKYHAVFEFLPIESIIKQKQKEYYQVLEQCDNLGNSTLFIEFMLNIINQALNELLKSQNINLNENDRIEIFKQQFAKKQFTRKDYLRVFKNISAATASRDLKTAVENGLLQKLGDKNTAVYWFKNNLIN